MDKIITALIGAIRKIWNFGVSMVFIGVIALFAVYFLTVFYPDNVITAFNIIKGFLGV